MVKVRLLYWLISFMLLALIFVSAGCKTQAIDATVTPQVEDQRYELVNYPFFVGTRNGAPADFPSVYYQCNPTDSLLYDIYGKAVLNDDTSQVQCDPGARTAVDFLQNNRPLYDVVPTASG